MKKCPNCSYLWADDYTGTCLECGAGMSGVEAPKDLAFSYANQIQRGIRENDMERAMKSSRGGAKVGDAYDRAPIHEAILNKAHEMLVQREEVRYEDL